MAAEEYDKRVRRLDTMMADAPFLTGDKVTIADCMAMALFQFAKGVYGVALPADGSKLVGCSPGAPACRYPNTLPTCCACHMD
ncbi:hypothetical protein D187_000362 [Cystobacter fuscus DSM 2262]|uniref:Glutathione S-transferase C-terminal domain-containing protein n=1 Tax=Cystobacter fuscus (strain ATCC 25194 / DSM 2262 / NBRC 100088 / M29) TaxID=1242864 RepID=S9QUE0_CYSF2|nr:glutathione S-transferase C-terminal domain-containing protein [Cystobacter fuscus]EPX64939.1 hypothetical protein D187_000362 [Cystobacter fuscus DSM 2262]